MNHLSREKRKQVVLVAVLTAIALSGIWFGLIQAQKQSLANIAERKGAVAKKLQAARQTIETAERVESQLCEADRRLKKLEEGMASGDLYSWLITTIRQFKLAHRVDIPQFSQVDGPKEMSLLPLFPYKQATLTVAGTAYFHDLGKFVADFENQFPYMRVLNVTMEPASALLSSDRERLSFRMDIVTLVKPGAV